MEIGLVLIKTEHIFDSLFAQTRKCSKSSKRKFLEGRIKHNWFQEIFWQYKEKNWKKCLVNCFIVRHSYAKWPNYLSTLLIQANIRFHSSTNAAPQFLWKLIPLEYSVVLRIFCSGKNTFFRRPSKLVALETTSVRAQPQNGSNNGKFHMIFRR